jgi:hypothetical protein
MTFIEAVHIALGVDNEDDVRVTPRGAMALNVLTDYAKVLPEIIAYLQTHREHEIIFSTYATEGNPQAMHLKGRSCRPGVRLEGSGHLDSIVVGDDPGAVVLAALSNWTQTNRKDGEIWTT